MGDCWLPRGLSLNTHQTILKCRYSFCNTQTFPKERISREIRVSGFQESRFATRNVLQGRVHASLEFASILVRVVVVKADHRSILLLGVLCSDLCSWPRLELFLLSSILWAFFGGPWAFHVGLGANPWAVVESQDSLRGGDCRNILDL